MYILPFPSGLYKPALQAIPQGYEYRRKANPNWFGKGQYKCSQYALPPLPQDYKKGISTL
ncbi:MAG: hypothetical protein ACRDDA_09195 [Aeromonas sp.]